MVVLNVHKPKTSVSHQCELCIMAAYSHQDVIMLRTFFFSALLIYSCLLQAKPSTPLYQIDLIVFTHQKPFQPPVYDSVTPLLIPDEKEAITLEHSGNTTITPYRILPNSASHLKNEYWALNRKPEYRVLFHYTWLQPANNQRPIALSDVTNGHWSVEGTLRIRRSNYYLLDTELVFSALNNPQTAFIFSQKQRLKPGLVYYFDHSQAGMLIKINPIA